ncbi:glycoside hydrolase domain-containing protein [Kitasatospora sp. NBC_01266]|uniref:glycoside hydrolase domain-containing protein n=1 Tax=Kitasatospora sp. NBC_01266 TaxID=2903572 RepID=UPI002E2F7F00|nr:glycoside hydrolase domain-containing protein [Kitasatospora sp. NBC_01266]
MNSRLTTGRRRYAVAATAALVASLTAVGSAQAASGTSDTKAVSYQNHVFHVPSGWTVVDLTADPHACVRFDQHTIYLGQPGTEQNCPAHLIGRTEALLVEPTVSGTPVGTKVDATGHEIDAADATVQVTGTYDTDEQSIRQIIAGAGLPTTAPSGRSAKAAAPRMLAAAPRSAAASSLSAAATVPASATSYTGQGFDACQAPSSDTMNAWMSASPYRAIGIYIGGSNRACSQTNLTASWVQQQQSSGWHFMPLYVGVQASGITNPATQGANAADDAVQQATTLGFAPGSVLYYDMESYQSTYTGSVLAFLTAWTNELHAYGFNSGVYSSSNSGMKDLVANAGNSGYTMPDVVFDANWNGVADTNDSAIPAGYWANHQRVHQYASPSADQTYGGYSIGIDQDYLDVQVTNVPPSQSSEFFLGTRTSSGNWPGFTPMSGVGGVGVFKGSEAAIAGMPDGTSQELGIGTDGNLYHGIRSTSGTLSGFAALSGVGSPNMAARKAGIAGMPNGSSQVLAIGNDGNVYHNIRSANGNWSGFAALPGIGTPNMAAGDVAIAGMPDGSSQVLAIGNDGNVYHEIRFANGNWSGFAALPGIGTPNMAAKRVAIAGMPDGSSQVLVIGNDGNVYHEIRFANGNWSGFAPLPSAGSSTMAASAVAIAGMPDGSSQVLAIGNDGNVYHNIRLANGNWSGFGAVPGPYGSNTFPAQRVGIAGMPDGSSQILATRS